MSMKDTFMVGLQYHMDLSKVERLEMEFVILTDTCSFFGPNKVGDLWDRYLIERGKYARQQKELVKKYLEKAQKLYPYKLTLLDQHKIDLAQGKLTALKKEGRL